MTSAPNPLSLSSLGARYRLFFWPKQLGTALGMTAFFTLYFAILDHPFFPVTMIPLTVVDHWIGFQPWALALYVSLWIYVPLLPCLMVEWRDLVRYVFAAATLSIIGLTIFTLWPTTIPRPDIDWTQYPSVAFLKTIDASGNTCPSLHVAFAVFTAIGFERLLRKLGANRTLRLGNLLWSGGIVYSTLATKQHIALDALAGALLGATVAGGFFCRRVLVVLSGLTKLSALLLWLAGLPAPWVLALFVSTDGFMLYHLLAPNSQALCRVFTRFHTGQPEVWLTIDDGPDEHDTPRLLDLLDQHQARATFFLIGELAARHPELVAEIQLRGHEIGHHTQTHPLASFWCASSGRLARELDDAFPALSLRGERPRRFRAPAGIKNIFLSCALAKRHLDCIGWSVRSCDSIARRPDRVVARVMKRVRPGAIVLMHEGARLHPRIRVEAIKRLLDALTARGFRCVVPTQEQLR